MTLYGVLESSVKPNKFYIYSTRAKRPYPDKPFLWPDGKWHKHTCALKDWENHKYGLNWIQNIPRPGYFNSREAAQSTLDRYLRRSSRS